ncbi:MAG: ABC transporter permease [Candidatus Bathyarchaeota archaeon]|nr:ABC transporter permease [Candidatus Bathyarchaeota archaeon]
MTTSSRWEEFKASMQPRIKEWKFMFKRVQESPLSLVGIAIILGFVILSALSPVLAPPPYADPFIIPRDEEIAKLSPLPTPPTIEHPFGTTDQHYDIYYACIWGTITAFRIGITTVMVALMIGIIIGVAAAYYGGLADEALMRFTDIIIAFPGLILAMALVIAIPTVFTLNVSFILVVIFGLTTFFAFITRARMKIKVILLIIFIAVLASVLLYPLNLRFSLNNLDKVLITLWLIGWPSYARVIRGEVLRVKNEDYIEAAKAAGTSDLGIVIKHILPNAIYPIIIMASLDIGSIVLTAAALSFLGLGAPPNYADWGQIIQRSRNWIGRELIRYMHVFLIPGIFIFVFVLGWNLLGDALRDVLDPTLRRR